MTKECKTTDEYTWQLFLCMSWLDALKLLLFGTAFVIEYDEGEGPYTRITINQSGFLYGLFRNLPEWISIKMSR